MLKSITLLKNRKASSRKNDLKVKKLQESLRHELETCLEEELKDKEVVCFEVPDNLLADFIDILDDNFANLYTFKQMQDKNLFEFSERRVF